MDDWTPEAQREYEEWMAEQDELEQDYYAEEES